MRVTSRARTGWRSGRLAGPLAMTAAVVLAMAGSSTAQVVALTPPAARMVRPGALADVGVHRLGSEVSINIDGATRVAHFEVQEEFRNESSRVLEGDYLYPIPRGAVFTNLSLFMGETELRGEMLDAGTARAIYEEIVRRRLDPALIEMVGEGLIRARVFPIEPGQTRKIILRYTQVLPREGGVVRLSYPRTTGLIAPHRRIDDTMIERRLAIGPTAAPRFALLARVSSASRFGTPISPTHSIDVHRRDGDVAEIVVRTPADSLNRSDFELLLPLETDDVGATLLAHSPAPGTESGYFMLMITPPASAEVSIARDVTLVLDVSGSMSGHKIEQARGAIEQILRGLRSEDRFRLITFASVVRSFDDDWMRANRKNVARAVEYLRGVPADGSTNIHDALLEALAPATDAERLSLVVFLTDGVPTVAETDPVRIADLAAELRDGERVFAFGVGEDVNTYLLDRLVEGGRGAVSYVRPDENVEAAISSLARKIGSPALADLRIVETPVGFEELYPGTLPDLFHGEELVILGRYRGAGSGALVLEGTRAGQTLRYRFELDFPHRRTDDEYVMRLWANRKAGALTAQLRLHGPNDELIDALRDLGLRYGVLTEYTAYLVQEPGVIGTERAREMVEQHVVRAMAAPRAQSGDVAFRRARNSAKQQQTSSLGEAEQMAADAVTAGGRKEVAAWQRVGRRIFVSRNEEWVDGALEADAPELAIAPYSDAWFDLLDRLPGLRAALALGDRVIIAGEGLTLRIESGGRISISAIDWTLLERAFPGEQR